MNTTPTRPSHGSLLEGLSGIPGDLHAPASRAELSPAAPQARTPSPLAALWSDRRVRYSTLAALLLAAGLSAYLLLRPVPQPDYATAPMNDVLDYTLLTDDFNKLPVEKRLDLIKELIARLKGMSGDDSMLMAMFAAGIDTDKLREQLMKNASLVAIDLWDKYARDYKNVPADQQDAYLDTMFLDFSKLMESMAGISSDKPDEQRLKEARDQAKADQNAFSTGKGPTGGQLARMTDFLRNGMGKNSSPQQQQRGQQLMRDLTRHLRGQDPSTGK